MSDDEYDGDSYNIRKGGKLDHHPNVHNFESPASGTGPNPAATSTRRNSAAGVTKNIINAPVPRQTRSKTNFVRNRQVNFACRHACKPCHHPLGVVSLVRLFGCQ